MSVLDGFNFVLPTAMLHLTTYISWKKSDYEAFVL